MPTPNEVNSQNSPPEYPTAKEEKSESVTVKLHYPYLSWQSCANANSYPYSHPRAGPNANANANANANGGSNTSGDANANANGNVGTNLHGNRDTILYSNYHNRRAPYAPRADYLGQPASQQARVVYGRRYRPSEYSFTDDPAPSSWGVRADDKERLGYDGMFPFFLFEAVG